MATIREIAEVVGAPVPSAAYEILRVSSIEAATPVALVFATDVAPLFAALNSTAGAILTRPALLLPGASVPAGQPALDLSDSRLLPVADPRYAFALAARFLESRELASPAPIGPDSAARDSAIGRATCPVAPVTRIFLFFSICRVLSLEIPLTSGVTENSACHKAESFSHFAFNDIFTG